MPCLHYNITPRTNVELCEKHMSERARYIPEMQEEMFCNAKGGISDRKGRGEGTGLLRLNQVFVHQTKRPSRESGAAFFGMGGRGALLSYDRNFGSIGNAGFAKVQRRIFDYHAGQGIAILEGILADARDGFAAKLR